ncbi:MAG TPA: N-acetylmuramoyl-L-alanine amidase [Candidatus Binatia bacterium]|nr:N-acetylmuramoyl-L-alanine amidase [Candidatus Binatia bacterium]
MYAPNPGAIVVAIEAGHGGCLDWGVPDPARRGEAYAEKTITLAVALALAERLEASGVTTVLVRDGDEALAGDDYPDLGCHGAPFRDVNGDGFVGFGGEELPEGTRTRDELQARIDLANLSAADVLLSLHVDSITDAAGNQLPIARTETFYTDETPWGDARSRPLAEALQLHVVAAMASVAGYEREDRGTDARNLYIVAPPLLEETPERPDRLKQPTRGALMPAVLVEIGTITLSAEHELLLTPEGAAAAASGLFEGLADFFGARELSGRIALADPSPRRPAAVDGVGPPFWPPAAPDGQVRLRLTNTGTARWPEGMALVAGWEASEEPYLAFPPAARSTVVADVPSLEPGASVVIEVTLPPAPPARGVAWISLEHEGETLADHGSPALQLDSGAP